VPRAVGNPALAHLSQGDVGGLLSDAKKDPTGVQAMENWDAKVGEKDPTGGMVHGGVEAYKSGLVFLQQSYDEHPDDHMIPGVNLASMG